MVVAVHTTSGDTPRPNHPIQRSLQRPAIHPLHAGLVAGWLTLFVGALLADLAYWSSYQVQWSDFSSWMIAAGLVLGGLALLAGVLGLFQARQRTRSYLLYLLLLAATWIVGFVNALVHAKDAWAVMPESLLLSVVAALMAAVATWFAFSAPRTGEIA